jgi:hypothetical protein
LKKARTCPDWLANEQWTMMKIAGSGSISKRHGSADPDPDPHQNVTGSATLIKTYRCRWRASPLD